MTLLLSWVGKDSRKISSFYIASDSRISWNKKAKFDYAQKVFAFDKSSDIMGYCGDVQFPTIILNQILNMANEEILFATNENRYERTWTVYKQIKSKFEEYPASDVMADSLEIIFVSRDKEIDFCCHIFKWTKASGWINTEIEVPNKSDKVIILGSGRNEFKNRYLEYLNGLNGKTSRALFQCLTHTLIDIKDLQCGGSPQLVGLYNKFNGQKFGVVYQGKRYFLGKEIDKSENINNIEWRNELFERCDGKTLKIKERAQRQPNELRP